MSGRRRSSSTRSASCSAKAARPDAPSGASRTLYPSSSRAIVSARRIWSSSSMNSSECMTATVCRPSECLPASECQVRDRGAANTPMASSTRMDGIVLLQESRKLTLGPSQTLYKMTTVHAAPVRCLPPPGASPAAVNPCHTGARVPPSSDAPAHQGHPLLRAHRVGRQRVADRRDVRLRPLLAARAARRGRPPAGRPQRRPGP